MKERTCFNCKFYDGWLCEYNYASKAILDEDETAKQCDKYTEGEFVDSDEHLLVD
ncbi:hypothetical protein [Lysinibacillus fusiformis]|uniref:hypothetical protein n=1 Tax=Lysinibacillus fusiformis TaxID=28031 RepID=UPI00263B2469|nr:hypothetical protein [Lysinibacillus fusiformis]MDC6267250.1 hypothetical protein [Lysinibacillus sphaericus]MDN4968316.1 hypothetical protein [Lysinibacillus fusiformis]MDN4968490.1 hypothetical protein [Lysinibacillus fusiformis]